jgi:hypothetical protein
MKQMGISITPQLKTTQMLECMRQTQCPLQLEFPQSKTFFWEMANLKSGGLKVMCVKFLQKQHLKHKKCYTWVDI